MKQRESVSSTLIEAEEHFDDPLKCTISSLFHSKNEMWLRCIPCFLASFFTKKRKHYFAFEMYAVENEKVVLKIIPFAMKHVTAAVVLLILS